jgi:transposase
MMGRKHRDQAKLFYEFRLDDMIPKGHLLRRINVFVTSVLGDLHEQLGPFYSDIGRPSIDPELLIRMLIIGYCFGIRSERKLCEEVRLHLAYRWFCRLDLDDAVPHHSIFSENRLNRFCESDILRHIFERVVFAARWVSSKVRDLPWMRASWRRTQVVITARRPMNSIGRRSSGGSVRWLSEATPARTYDEVAATRTMLDRTEERFDLKPSWLAADTAYGTGKFLGWLVKKKKIIPHIPVWEMSDRQDGIFSRSDFHWDRKRGAYVCPNGKLLKTSGTVHDGRTLLYRAPKRDCDVCPIRVKCCTTADARKIPRDIHEDARDIARRKMKTKAFAKSRDERRRVEMRFAHLKTHHGFERMRLRGLSGARGEFHLAAIAQNLKTLAPITAQRLK